VDFEGGARDDREHARRVRVDVPLHAAVLAAQFPAKHGLEIRARQDEGFPFGLQLPHARLDALRLRVVGGRGSEREQVRRAQHSSRA